MSLQLGLVIPCLFSILCQLGLRIDEKIYDLLDAFLIMVSPFSAVIFQILPGMVF